MSGGPIIAQSGPWPQASYIGSGMPRPGDPRSRLRRPLDLCIDALARLTGGELRSGLQFDGRPCPELGLDSGACEIVKQREIKQDVFRLLRIAARLRAGMPARNGLKISNDEEAGS